MLRLLGLMILLMTGLAAATVDRVPLVPPAATPDSDSAVRAHSLVRRLLAVRRDPAPVQTFAIDAAELNAVARLAPRFVPGLRMEVSLSEGGMSVRAAQPLGFDLWLNMEAVVAPADTGLRLQSLSVGALPLPAQPMLTAAIALADVVLGRPSASALVGGLRDTRIGTDGVQTVLALPLETREAISARLQRAARQVAVRADVTSIDAVLAAMHAAQRGGTLPQTGTALPYLRFAVEAARAQAEARPGTPREAAGAALIALAIACGERHLQTVTGTEAERPASDQAWYCRRTTLGGRVDLRQHFAVSAGLKAASDLGAAVLIGELKELYDSRPRGSGFSFDDLAANRAGVAFATLLMDSPPADWPALLARLDSEAALLPPLADLPSGMSAAQFERDFGDIESPEFAALVAEIDRRIAALPLHRAGGDRPG